MSGCVRSVNVAPSPVGALSALRSGIAKAPVADVDIRGPHDGGSGVVGDTVVNRKHHGGSDKAVYAFAREELDWWQRELGRDLPDGVFGENLTTEGIDLESLCLGQRLSFGGGVVLEVSLPRQPCATFAHHMGERGWVRRFTERGRCGAYLRVRTPGTVAAGEHFRVGARPRHDIDLRTAFAAAMGDREAAQRVVSARCLPADHHERMARRLSPL